MRNIHSLHRGLWVLFITFTFHSASFSQKAQKPTPDSVLIKQTVTSFYNWYNKNWQKADAFRLFKGKKGGYNPPYVIDWKEADRYFAWLKKVAPQLHPLFYEAERKYFKQVQKNFDDYPDEEIAIGFDADRYTNSQDEPQWFVDALKKAVRWEIKYASKGDAMLTVWNKGSDDSGDYEYQLMCFGMKKVGANWKIAAILACEDVEF